MISFLRGTLAALLSDAAVIDVGGVGYKVLMSSRALSRLGAKGEVVHVFTHLALREDALVLYGFLTPEEHDLFMRLISVSSVGPKVALSVLSTFEPAEAIAAIAAQDVASIQRVPGVGKKMASRIALELKEVFGKDIQAASGTSAPGATSAQKAANEALLSMGFTSTEADLALKGAPEGANEALLLQYALKRLGE